MLVVPGFRASDANMWPLRRYLRSLGYNVRGWGLGRSGGNVRDLTPRLIDTSHLGLTLSPEVYRLVARRLAAPAEAIAAAPLGLAV